MNEAEKTVEDVKRIQRLLKAETGLHSIASADNQVKGRHISLLKLNDIVLLIAARIFLSDLENK